MIFVLAGLYVGTEDALEDSVAAELVPKEQHGMAFGTLAAVNAAGDFLEHSCGIPLERCFCSSGFRYFYCSVFCGRDTHFWPRR